MKKVVSLILSLILLFSVSVNAFAVAPPRELSKYPIIYFRGNSEQIADEDGNIVYDFDVTGDQIKEIAKKVLPLLLKGYITNNFDEYYKAFEDEMSKLYDKVILDGNGDPRYGTGITQEQKDRNNWEMNTDRQSNGKYDINVYDFANDWRLDPLKTIEDAKVYIDNVRRVTGKDKVCLACKCLGGDLILAYLAKYGTEHINAVCFGSTVAFGGCYINGIYTGNIDLDGETLDRFVNDGFVNKIIPQENKILIQFLQETATLLKATGTMDGALNLIMEGLYKKLYKGLVPALVTSTYGTWPGYWTMISPENYETARDFIFGKEGSEKRTNYAGLIEKLDNYDALVRQRIPDILKQAEADGVNICITSKYGFQMPPITTTKDEQGDVWAETSYSSLGGTVSKVGKTLSSEYIESRKALGLDKYISPDKQIDASTCVFPQYTWFIKGAIHDDWATEEDNIIIRVCNSDEQITVDTMENRPQFLVYDREEKVVYPMTEDNCNTEKYEVNEKPQTTAQSIWKAVISWFRAMFDLFRHLLTKNAA